MPDLEPDDTGNGPSYDGTPGAVAAEFRFEPPPLAAAVPA